MASESKRELIIQNLKTTLEGIDGNDPYWTGVRSVKRVNTVPTDLEGEEKPGLLIVLPGEQETNEPKHGYHDVRTIKVGIIGIIDVQNNEDDYKGRAVNRFMKDVTVAVMADVTRGDFSATETNASMTMKTYQQDLSNLFGDLGIFEMELLIRYHCDAKIE